MLGLSLGGINYVLKALIKKGYVKVQHFKNSDKKISYVYVLTPKWIYEKAKITNLFIQKKLAEYERLKEEIENLRSEE